MNFISENPNLNIVSVTSVPWKSYVFYFLQMQESLNPLSGRHREYVESQCTFTFWFFTNISGQLAAKFTESYLSGRLNTECVKSLWISRRNEYTDSILSFKCNNSFSLKSTYLHCLRTENRAAHTEYSYGAWEIWSKFICLINRNGTTQNRFTKESTVWFLISAATLPSWSSAMHSAYRQALKGAAIFSPKIKL